MVRSECIGCLLHCLTSIIRCCYYTGIYYAVHVIDTYVVGCTDSPVLWFHVI